MSIPLPALAVVIVILAFACAFCAFIANENCRHPQDRNWMLLSSLVWLVGMCCDGAVASIASIVVLFLTYILVAGWLSYYKVHERSHGIGLIMKAMKR